MSDLQFNEYPDTASEQNVSISPRLGTFELFANLGGADEQLAVVCMFSKKMNGMWPSFAVLGQKVAHAKDEAEMGINLNDLK